MCEKRCKTCKSWGVMTEDGCLVMVTGSGYLTGYCTSPCTPIHSDGSMLPTPHHFGCIHWRERKLDFRERLAIYLHNRLGDFRDFSGLTNAEKNDCLKIADEIIAMFEKEKRNERKEM